MITIKLLNRLFRNQRPLLNGDAEYEAALAEIRRQSLAGQIHHLLIEHGMTSEPPSFFLNDLAELQRAEWMTNMTLKLEAEPVIASLESNGIRTIVLKGIWLSRILYGKEGVRRTGDIDILVRPEDVDRVTAVLAERQFHAASNDCGYPYHALFYKPAANGKKIAIELHWHLISSGSCMLDCNRLWEQSVPLTGYAHMREFAIPDQFYTLAIHGAKHVMCSVKHVLDLVRMLHLYRELIDYPSLLERARREHTYGMVVMALSVAYRLFPHLHVWKPFPECRRWFSWDQGLAFRRNAGFRKFKGFRFYGQQLVFQLAKLDNTRYRLRYVKRLVFPHKVEMRAYLGLPDTTPGWRLYVGWHGRFLTSGRSRRHAGSS
ncbi:nucleotidyltransferase family protein [Cohnella faecalis]|uniref:Nucleotidyltransferase family protein n=1 Tax=Cohnella faecalis TaxID=2315694 RepID=A0A398CSU3_9BACL|nr:nucleotidyltransferase family protein [Cohnella faecalis]RIE03828.1 hypothetical protein D3H35_09755 [Cohnella faecalis]